MSQEHVLEAATRLLEALVRDLERAAVGARLLRLLLFRVCRRRASSMTEVLARPGARGAEPGRPAYRPADRPAPASPRERARCGLRLRGRGRACAGCREPGRAPGPARSSCRRRGIAQCAGSAVSACAGGTASTCAGGARPAGGACAADRPAAAAPGQGRRAAAASAPEPYPRARRAATLPLSPSPRSSREEADARSSAEWGETTAPRPLLMLERPETAEVLAVVPDGPPGISAGAACCIRWPRRKAPSASRPNGGAGRPRGRATTTSSRTRGAPLLALPRRPLRAERRPHPAMVRARGVRMSARARSPPHSAPCHPNRSEAVTGHVRLAAPKRIWNRCCETQHNPAKLPR